MPVVAMPDGTNVQMPDKIDPAMAQRLRAFQSAKGGGKGPPPDKAPPEMDELPFKNRTMLAAMDNPAEKQAYLEKAFGKANVTKDDKGFVVKKDGKQFRASEGFLASMAADFPETAGGIIGAGEGALMGAPGGPAGALVGAVIGGGVGAASGKAAKETVKTFAGLNKKGVAGTAESIGKEGLGGAAGEVGGKVIGKGIGALSRGPLPAFLTGATKEIRTMTDKMLRGGARPPAASTMPDARKLQRVAILADKLSGPSPTIEKANTGYLRDQVDHILDKANLPKKVPGSTPGISPQKLGVREDIQGRLEGGTSALSSQQTGSLIQNTSKMMLNQAKGKAATYLATLTRAAKSPEDAYNWLTAPGQTDRMDRFVKIMGKNSAVVEAVQHQSLRHVLAGAMVRSADGKASDSLVAEMSKYTPKQQDMLFPNGLGKDLVTLGKEIKFLYPGPKDPAMASLTAGAIMQHVWYNRFYAQGTYALMRTVLQKPAVIRRLAIGFRGTSLQRKAAQTALSQMMYFGAIEASKADFGDDQASQADHSKGVTEATHYANSAP